VMVVGLLGLIAVRGLGHFWPSAVYEFSYQAEDDGDERTTVLGHLRGSETLPAAVVREAGFAVPEDHVVATRHLFKVGNRDVTGQDFVWYVAPSMGAWTRPEDVMVLERREWGDFIGRLVDVREDGEVVATGEEAWAALQARVDRARDLHRQMRVIERKEIGDVNARMERLRLERRRLELRNTGDPARFAALDVAHAELEAEYAKMQARLDALSDALGRDSLRAQVMDGREVTIPVAHVVEAWRPNAMGVFAKTGHYLRGLKDFVTGYPREANTEGGIFPAIFGTVMMVLLMSVFVTPFGILAAIYLREYAKQGPVVRIIRIAVNNLPGVPSIVFGVFGLGFFVYFVGGGLDRIFFPESLPAPTFGTPGLLWAALTLALLTLPVVIVSTEEGLARIPRSIREGSLALGATKSETLWRTVVPMSAPAMMTGLILAVARAAGEVAPLMLVGVVKLAPNLPVDGSPPFLHLERKFMHLGFHIYDVGFQSPNVEAARPLVYATALMLVAIIVALNLAAIAIRNRLRERFRAAGE
jgi:phosphate transport system permease protein